MKFLVTIAALCLCLAFAAGQQYFLGQFPSRSRFAYDPLALAQPSSASQVRDPRQNRGPVVFPPRHQMQLRSRAVLLLAPLVSVLCHRNKLWQRWQQRLAVWIQRISAPHFKRPTHHMQHIIFIAVHIPIRDTLTSEPNNNNNNNKNSNKSLRIISSGNDVGGAGMIHTSNHHH
ncbi:hypothetical protein ACLKA6_009690 [Drosophila palustris]